MTSVDKGSLHVKSLAPLEGRFDACWVETTELSPSSSTYWLFLVMIGIRSPAGKNPPKCRNLHAAKAQSPLVGMTSKSVRLSAPSGPGHEVTDMPSDQAIMSYASSLPHGFALPHGFVPPHTFSLPSRFCSSLTPSLFPQAFALPPHFLSSLTLYLFPHAFALPSRFCSPLTLLLFPYPHQHLFSNSCIEQL